jgi:hypothetical protein
MFAFHTPMLLWGLAGLAVPLFIHLVSRQPARLWEFPSLRFLRSVPVPRHGRRRINDPLLLLLRSLLFALLVMLAAGPHWRAAPPTDVPVQTRLLVIDVSASMGGWNNMERARTTAFDLMAQHSADIFGMVLFADDALTTLPPDPDRSALTAALRDATPTWFAANPEAGLAAARMLTQEAAARWHVISDFQRSAWDELRWRVPPAVAVELHPLPRPPAAGNRAIVNAAAWLRADRQLEVLATLRNDSAQPHTVDLVLEAETGRWTRSVSLAAYETTTATLIVPPTPRPAAVLRIEGEDALAADNAWHVFLGDHPPVRIAALRDPEGSPRADEELFFLHTALSTRNIARGLHYQLMVADPLALAALPDGIAVVVVGHELSGMDIDYAALHAFAEHGGTVLLTLGDEALAALSAMRHPDLPNWRYAGHTGRGLYINRAERIAALPATSRLAQVFDAASARDLYLASLYAVARLSGVYPAHVLLTSEAGDPLLIEVPFGAGRWIVSTIPFHGAATDLPLRNAFLPLVHELLKVAAPADGGMRHGVARNRPPPAAWATAVPTAIWHQPGVWLGGAVPLIINLDRRESDPTTLPVGELNRRVYGLAAGSPHYAGALPDTARTFPLWRWFAVCGGLLFVVETIVAMRAARASRRALPVTTHTL